MRTASRQNPPYETAKLSKLCGYRDNCTVKSVFLLELGYNEGGDRPCEIDVLPKINTGAAYSSNSKSRPKK